MICKIHCLFTIGLLAGIAALSSHGSAMTLDITDGTTYTLSAAVAEVYASDDGPDIINLNVSSLPTADGQVLLNQPITINGNANNRNSPDNYCDLLADAANIQLSATQDVGQAGKAYIEINAPGDVNLNNLKIHPNANGKFAGTSNVGTIVAGIRMFNPDSGTGNYNFTQVLVSGSDGNGTFVPPDSGADLYNTPDMMHWGGFNGAQHVNTILYGIIQAQNGTGPGIFNILLDHCQCALGYGGALNINSTGGTTLVKGGVYGHCGYDAIHVQSTSVTLQGTHDDRIRVVRCANTTATGRNAHGVEVMGDVDLMEYIDSENLFTANNFNFQSGHTKMMRFCRALGKFDTGPNESVYIAGATTAVDYIEDCTFVGSGNNFVPFHITSGVVSPVIVKDCIFSSESSGTVILDSPAALTFINSAFPTDGLTSETLNDPPITGLSVTASFTPSYTDAPYNASPHYILNRLSYDWSDAQGSGQNGNGAGNANVLRPSNPAYQTASSTSGPLNGGAGAPAAGIDSSDWMLM